jgi:hypothetical protein
MQKINKPLLLLQVTLTLPSDHLGSASSGFLRGEGAGDSRLKTLLLLASMLSVCAVAAVAVARPVALAPWFGGYKAVKVRHRAISKHWPSW